MGERLPPREPEWDNSDLPRRYWDNSGVTDLHREQIEAIEAIQPGDERQEKWLRAFHAVREALNSGGIVALLGPRGCGKTQIAAKLLKESCLAEKVPALYRRAGDIFREIRSSFNSRSTTESSILDRLTRIPILVIDEAQERAGTEFESGILTCLIDSRYTSRKSTLLISNETPDALAESIGSSVADRLRESGKVIVCRWKSFRQKHGGGVIQIIE